MQQYDIEQFSKLENIVWQALVEGDRSADDRMLEDDFLGVYDSGFSDKAGHVGQLGSGPTIAEYRLSQHRLLHLSEGVVLLSYLADFRRVGHGQSESMYVSSIWRASRRGWLNIFSQDTKARG